MLTQTTSAVSISIMPSRTDIKKTTATPKHGLARVMSKLGLCSRTQAIAMILAGRVSVDGRVQRNPERPSDLRERIAIDGKVAKAPERVYLALNKPRGLVVTAADDRDRETVFDLLKSSGLPYLAPVGRLDKASEGLLLMSNDSEWAARVTDSKGRILKTYHVQISGIPDQSALDAMRRGIEDDGEHFAVADVRILRTGEKNCWLEIALDEGRNRHLRRLLAALNYTVLRLIRVAVGPVALGTLAKGQWRALLKSELDEISSIR
jgi:23S rRNA pseudouridine2605 synthase